MRKKTPKEIINEEMKNYNQETLPEFTPFDWLQSLGREKQDRKVWEDYKTKLAPESNDPSLLLSLVGKESEPNKTSGKPQEISPVVREYLTKKINESKPQQPRPQEPQQSERQLASVATQEEDPFSDAKREELKSKNAEKKSDLALAQFVSGLGDAFAGRAPNTQYFQSLRKDLDKETEDFDQRKRQAREDTVFKRQQELFDPQSQRSKVAQDILIEQYGFNPEKARRLTAEQVETVVPHLKFKIEKELRSKEFQQRMNENELNRDIKREQIEASKAQRDQKQKEGTASQYAARGFGKRLEQSEAVFSELEKLKYDRSEVSSGIGSKLPNVLRSDDAVRQDQAERNFINAVLRRESGAAIAPSEFESAEQQYFPRAGDGPKTLAQKKANRRTVLENLKKESGRTWGNESEAQVYSPQQERGIEQFMTQNSLSREKAISVLQQAGRL